MTNQTKSRKLAWILLGTIACVLLVVVVGSGSTIWRRLAYRCPEPGAYWKGPEGRRGWLLQQYSSGSDNQTLIIAAESFGPGGKLTYFKQWKKRWLWLPGEYALTVEVSRAEAVSLARTLPVKEKRAGTTIAPRTARER